MTKIQGWLFSGKPILSSHIIFFLIPKSGHYAFKKWSRTCQKFIVIVGWKEFSHNYLPPHINTFNSGSQDDPWCFAIRPQLRYSRGSILYMMNNSRRSAPWLQIIESFRRKLWNLAKWIKHPRTCTVHAPVQDNNIISEGFPSMFVSASRDSPIFLMKFRLLLKILTAGSPQIHRCNWKRKIIFHQTLMALGFMGVLYFHANCFFIR